MGLDTLQSGLTGLISKIKGFLGTPIGAASAGVVSGVIVGGTAVAVGQAIKRRRKKSNGKKRGRRKKASSRRRRGSHRRSKSRRIVRGRGLGFSEIHHGHRGSKMVSFRTKDGKLVRFRTKGSQKKHLGSRRK